MVGDVSSPGTLALPHERDESTERPDALRAPIEQARHDLAAGQVDTDCYASIRRVVNRAKPRSD